MRAISNHGRGTGRLRAIALRDALSPAQAFAGAWASRGMTGIQLPTAQYYTAPLSAPGVLVDALGGPTYTAVSAAGTPLWVPPGHDGPNGVPYIAGDGISKTLIGDASEPCATYCAVIRSPPGQPTWNDYGSIIGGTVYVDLEHRLALFKAGDTTFGPYPLPRAARRNGVDLTGNFDLGPTTDWMIVTVRTNGYTVEQVLQLFATEGGSYMKLHLAALGKWSSDPTDDQIIGAESDASIYTSIAVEA